MHYLRYTKERKQLTSKSLNVTQHLNLYWITFSKQRISSRIKPSISTRVSAKKFYLTQSTSLYTEMEKNVCYWKFCKILLYITRPIRKIEQNQGSTCLRFQQEVLLPKDLILLLPNEYLMNLY